MGITPNAQWHLGKIPFVDLSPAGTKVEKGQKIGEIEGVKAALEIYSPLSVQIIEVNEAALAEPSLVNEDPLGSGWLMRVEMTDPSQLDLLMTNEEYEKMDEQIHKQSES